jgi:hypothetical protein
VLAHRFRMKIRSGQKNSQLDQGAILGHRIDREARKTPQQSGVIYELQYDNADEEALVSERREVSVELRLRSWDPRCRSLDVRSQDASFQKAESRIHTNTERKSGLSIPFRIQRANLPSRFRIREKCVEPNGGRNKVNVSLDSTGTLYSSQAK